MAGFIHGLVGIGVASAIAFVYVDLFVRLLTFQLLIGDF